MGDFYRGYYIAIDKTGVPVVDAISQALCEAERAHHHTEMWGDESDGESHQARIGAAVGAAAVRIAEFEAEVDRLRKREAESQEKAERFRLQALEWFAALDAIASILSPLLRAPETPRTATDEGEVE